MTAVIAVFFYHTLYADVYIKDIVIESFDLSVPRGMTSAVAIYTGTTISEEEYSMRIERSLAEIRKHFSIDFVGSWFYDAYDGRTVVFSISRRPYYTFHGADIGVEVESHGLLYKELGMRLIVSEKMQAFITKFPFSERGIFQFGLRSFLERKAWGISDQLIAADITLRYTPYWWSRMYVSTEAFQRDGNEERRSLAMKTGVEISTTTRNQFNRHGWFAHVWNDSVVSHTESGSDFSYSSLYSGIYMPWKRINIDLNVLITEGVTNTDRFPVLYPFSQRYFKGNEVLLDGSYVFCELTTKWHITDKGYVSLFGASLSDASTSLAEFGIGLRGHYFITVGVDYAITSNRLHFGFIGYSF